MIKMHIFHSFKDKLINFKMTISKTKMNISERHLQTKRIVFTNSKKQANLKKQIN